MKWSPPCDVVSLQDRRIEAALADERAVVVVTLRLVRAEGFTARDLEIDYGETRPAGTWLATELHRAGLDVAESWDDLDEAPVLEDVEPDPDNVRPMGPRGRS